MSVTISKDASGVKVESPYDLKFVHAAKGLGGRWGGGVWTFDARDEEAVRRLAVEIYGTDGSDAPPVTVRVPVGQARYEREWRVAGMTLVMRPGRDMPVRFGPGVVVVEGGFASSGGSVKNPDINAKEGTVVEVRDVSPGVARKIVAEAPGAVIVGQDAQLRDGLAAERARLVARIAEIDATLAAVPCA